MSTHSLRKSRTDHLERLVKVGTLSEYQDRREFPVTRSYEKRIDEGLMSIGETGIRNKIKNCYNSPLHPNSKWTHNTSICGNIYCKGCRNVLANIHYHKVMSHIERSCMNTKYVLKEEPMLWEEFDRIFETRLYTNDDFLHITGYVGLSTMRIDDLKKIIKNDTNRWKKIRRNLNKITDGLYWIEASYEYELVNWRFLRESSESDYKKKQIRQLIESTDRRFFNEPFVFVHFHGLTNIPKNTLSKVFKDVYLINGKPLIKTHSETGLYVQKLHKDKTLEQNVRKITSYPFKTAYRYKHSFLGSDFKNGEYFTDEELGNIVRIYDQMTGRGYRTLFRTASNNLDVWTKIHTNIDNLIKLTKEKWRGIGFDNNRMLLLTRMVEVIKEIEVNEGNCSKVKIKNLIDQISKIEFPKNKQSEVDMFTEYWNRRKNSLPKLSSNVGEPFPFKSKNTNYVKSIKRVLSS